MLAIPLLLSPEALAAWLDTADLLLVDLGKASTYEQVHLPGAVHLNPVRLLSEDSARPGLLPAPEALTELLSSLGLKPHQHLVAYDDEGGCKAARLLWILDAVGHAGYSLLDGGIHAWLAADLPYQIEPVVPQASLYSLAAYRTDTGVVLDDLLAHLQDENRVIWDARSPEEYHGERQSARRAGHIPGAVNYEWKRALQDEETYQLRDLAVIRQELADLGIRADRDIITHCQTHQRSSFTWLLGRLLGFEGIRAYPGAWIEWGNREDTPVVASGGR